MSHEPVWQLHDAKARFSELFRRVRTQGPQRVVKQGGDAVVVIPAEEFDRAEERVRPKESLVDFFRSAPTGVAQERHEVRPEKAAPPANDDSFTGPEGQSGQPRSASRRAFTA